MVERINELKLQAKERIGLATSSNDIENLRVEYLGKKGKVVEILKDLKNIEPEKRKEIAMVANQAKDEIEKLMSDMKRDLYPEPTEEDIKEMEEAFNLTQKEKQMQEFNEFIEQSKKDYDFENREEYNYGR